MCALSAITEGRLRRRAPIIQGDTAMAAEAKLKELGITLPDPPRPVATYNAYARTGNLLFISGQLPLVEGRLHKVGKVGSQFSLEEAQEACRRATLNALAVVRQATGS